MKAWEIWSYQPPGWPDPHPAVIVSAPSRVANKPDVNVLMCSSKQATRQAMPNEVILDASDGLNWPTLCKCDLLHLVAKDELKQRRGTVTPERRKQIIATINRANDWV
jgi:mRNA-degrading endonuclease toxin of MazEF toxin-antitoxin module